MRLLIKHLYNINSKKDKEVVIKHKEALSKFLKNESTSIEPLLIYISLQRYSLPIIRSKA